MCWFSKPQSEPVPSPVQRLAMLVTRPPAAFLNESFTQGQWWFSSYEVLGLGLGLASGLWCGGKYPQFGTVFRCCGW